MFRHLVRQTVKFGEYREFIASLKEVNALSASVGLPQYRAWEATFGGWNEVFTEADYDSLDAHVAAWDKASKNDAFMAAFRKLSSHITSGQDWPLRPIEL